MLPFRYKSSFVLLVCACTRSLDIYQKEGSLALSEENLWRFRRFAVSLCKQKVIIMASNSDFVQYIADVDDRDYLSLLVRETCMVLPEPKAAIKRGKN